MPDLLHHVRVLVALYEDDMEALPGGDNDPVPSWDDVMRELRKAIAEVGACRLSEAADTSGLREALDVLDVIDGIVDDTHPEGDGCPLCTALDDLRAALEGATERPLDGACNDPACAYREEVRLGHLVTAEALRAAERRATEAMSAIVVAVGGEVRVPDRVVVAGSSLSAESDPVAHETVYRASPTTETPA
jgi:hypothetical protein